jgi:hypothetical protein
MHSMAATDDAVVCVCQHARLSAMAKWANKIHISSCSHSSDHATAVQSDVVLISKGPKDRSMCQLGLCAFQQTDAGVVVRGSKLRPVHVQLLPLSLLNLALAEEASGWACLV